MCSRASCSSRLYVFRYAYQLPWYNVKGKEVTVKAMHYKSVWVKEERRVPRRLQEYNRLLTWFQARGMPESALQSIPQRPNGRVLINPKGQDYAKIA
jgi:hypothetical protein